MASINGRSLTSYRQNRKSNSVFYNKHEKLSSLQITGFASFLPFRGTQRKATKDYFSTLSPSRVPLSCGVASSGVGAIDHNVKSRRRVSCRTRGAPVPPINLVMAEKLPRLRLKTHPATAIFSQHLRITRNCRSFVPSRCPSIQLVAIRSWELEAVHCLTREPVRVSSCRENAGIIVMSNRKLTLNRGHAPFFLAPGRSPGTRRPSAEPRRKTGTLVRRCWIDRPCRMSELLNSRGIIEVHCSGISGSRNITVLFPRF